MLSAETVLLHTGHCHSSTGGCLPSRCTLWNRARSCLHLCLGAIALLLISRLRSQDGHAPSSARRPGPHIGPEPQTLSHLGSGRARCCAQRAVAWAVGWAGPSRAACAHLLKEPPSQRPARFGRTSATVRARAHRPPPATGPRPTCRALRPGADQRNGNGRSPSLTPADHASAPRTMPRHWITSDLACTSSSGTVHDRLTEDARSVLRPKRSSTPPRARHEPFPRDRL